MEAPACRTLDEEFRWRVNFSLGDLQDDHIGEGTRRLAMTCGNQYFKLRSVLKSAGDPEKPREGITGKLTGR